MPSPADRNKTQPFRISLQTWQQFANASIIARNGAPHLDATLAKSILGHEDWNQTDKIQLSACALAKTPKRHDRSSIAPLWAFRHRATMISMTPRRIEEAGKTFTARAGFLISHRQGGRNFHSAWKTAEPTDIEARRNHPADERAAVRAWERREREDLMRKKQKASSFELAFCL